ncbi:MAG: alpha/beta hydrolase [Proteobacteria bacterium]|nr:alpha/beta hydrolase [Pseudomonadota bacterium]
MSKFSFFAVGFLFSDKLLGQAPNRLTPVGRTHKLFFDEARKNWIKPEKRPLATTIWYPAVTTAKERAWNIAVFKAGWSAKDAAISTNQDKYPLVVLSHGTGGAAMQLSWLAETLASNGYIVAAVNHHGNTVVEDKLLAQGFVLWWERARDISVLIDKLLMDEQFGNRIVPSEITMAGFSLGGYTAIALAGGITDRDQWQIFCHNTPLATICQAPPESDLSIEKFKQLSAANPQIASSILRSKHSYKDARIKAVYVIAPVLAPAFTQTSLTNIQIPVKIIVGDKDQQATPKFNADFLAKFIPNAHLQILKDVSHYTFLANCTLQGKWFVKELCADIQGINRHEIHTTISQDALDFFDNIRRKSLDVL